MNSYTGLAIGFLSVLFVGIFFTYFIKNPFYLFFCVGLLICGGVLIMPILLLLVLDILNEFSSNILFLFPLIVELLYIFNLVKGTGMSSVAKKVFIGKFGGFMAFGGKKINKFWHDEDPEIRSKKILEARKAQRQFEKKYKMYWLILISFICVIGFFTALMMSATY